jgi:hypothetical protein
MRRKVLAGLILLNGALAAALLATPTSPQVGPLGLFDCCKTDNTALEPYCCERCCWFTRTCTFDEDCQPQVE